MKETAERRKVKVTGLKRLNNTVDGNPRWKVEFDLGHAITAPNVSDSYLIGDWMLTNDVELAFDGRGRIVYVYGEPQR